MIRGTLLLGLSLAVCNSPASETGDSPAQAPLQSADPSPEWDRPMPFVDQGWFCKRSSKPCVWSEEAVDFARWSYVDEVHPPKAFCYSGAWSDDFDFRRCGRTLEFCNIVRSSDPSLDSAKPCRAMSPTEFWRENPAVVEAHRKACKPQECPNGYHWVGAVKVRGETLDFAPEPIEQLSDGFFAVPSAGGRPRGYALSEDENCVYGCEIGCPLYTFACEGSTCSRCFSAESVSRGACEAYLEECAEVMLAEPKDRQLCTTDGARPCRDGKECIRRYSDAVPEEIRVQGNCHPASTP